MEARPRAFDLQPPRPPSSTSADGPDVQQAGVFPQQRESSCPTTSQTTDLPSMDLLHLLHEGLLCIRNLKHFLQRSSVLFLLPPQTAVSLKFLIAHFFLGGRGGTSRITSACIWVHADTHSEYLKTSSHVLVLL